MSGEVLLRRSASPLSYPAGVSRGVSSAHPMSAGLILSVVASGGSMLRLDKTELPVLTSTAPTAILDSRLGPATQFVVGNTRLDYGTAKAGAVGESYISCAAIFTLTSVPTVAHIVNTANDGSGTGLQVNGGNLMFRMNGGQTPIIFTPVAGVPYFVIASKRVHATLGVVNWAVVRLDTGAIISGSTAALDGGTNAEVGSKICVGERVAASTCAPMKLAAVALSYPGRLIPIPELVAAAQDPWSFWYPQRNPRRVPLDAIDYTKGGGGVLPRRRLGSPLAYPAGVAPGFDSSHVAASGTHFSGIAHGTGYVSLTDSQKLTVPGTAPSNSVDGYLGKASNFSGGATNNFWVVPNRPTAIETDITIAAIVKMTVSGASNQGIFCSDSSNTGGVGLRLTAGDNIGIVYTSRNAINSGITLSVNVPYFIAASRTPSDAVFVVVNLLTGKVQTASVGGGASTPLAAGASSYAIGMYAAQVWNGQIAAVMHSGKFTPLATLLQWAADPWSFWYPQSKPNFYVLPQYLQDHPPGGFTLGIPLRRLRSPLAYPGGMPGFDPSHVASKGCQLSSVVTGKAAVNLLRPSIRQTNTGILTGVDGQVGPYVQGDGTSNVAVSFPAGSIQGTALLNGITFGVIAYVAGLSLAQYVVAAGASGGNAWSLRIGTTGTVQVAADSGGFVTYATPAFLVVGHSYFIAAAVTPGAGCKFVIRDLTTGGVASFSASSVTGGPTSVATSASIGKGFTNGLSGLRVHCITFGESILSPAQLLAWAQDPWSFWYPKREFVFGTSPDPATGNTIFSQVVAAAAAATTFVVKGVGKLVSATSSGTTSVIKSVGKRVLPIASSAVSAIKSAGKIVSSASTGAVSLLKAGTKTVTAACSGSVTVTKNVGKRIIAACTSSTLATAIKVFLVTVSAACTGTVTRFKSIGKLVLPSATGTVTTRKGIARTIAVSATSAASFVKSATKSFVASCSAGVTTVRQFIANGAGFVYQVTVSAAVSTLVSWLPRWLRPRTHHVASPRTGHHVASPRNSGWPATQRTN